MGNWKKRKGKRNANSVKERKHRDRKRVEHEIRCRVARENPHITHDDTGRSGAPGSMLGSLAQAFRAVNGTRTETT